MAATATWRTLKDDPWLLVSHLHFLMPKKCGRRVWGNKPCRLSFGASHAVGHHRRSQHEYIGLQNAARKILAHFEHPQASRVCLRGGGDPPHHIIEAHPPVARRLDNAKDTLFIHLAVAISLVDIKIGGQRLELLSLSLRKTVSNPLLEREIKAERNVLAGLQRAARR